MIYSLSRRQEKTLNVSRQPLLIYLPCPPVVPADPARWAAEHLPSVAGMISTASIETAICQPTVRGGVGPVAAFGLIRQEWAEDQYCYCINVVAVLLRPQRVRGGVIGPMWPGGEMTKTEDDEESPQTEDDSAT